MIDEQVCSFYKSNKSVYWIQKTLNITRDKILKILKENNITIISKAKRLNPSFKEDYFENIDSNEKAYWLGWLITDGSIFRDGIYLTLQKGDKYILELFQKDLGLADHIKPFKDNYMRLLFWSKKMVNDLAKYGIVPNKTDSVIIPDIKDEFKGAIIRGCLDGDGGLSIVTSRGKYEHELSFTGNYENVSKFNHLISESCGLKPRNILKNHSIWRVRWSKHTDILTICKFIYENSNEHRLIRKYNKFIEIKDHYEL